VVVKLAGRTFFFFGRQVLFIFFGFLHFYWLELFSTNEPKLWQQLWQAGTFFHSMTPDNKLHLLKALSTARVNIVRQGSTLCIKGKHCALISAPETRGLGNQEVSVRGKMDFELIVHKDGSLFEAIRAFADLEVDKTFGVKVLVGEIVLGDDFLGNIVAVDMSEILKSPVK
jgi:hypothetical protein